MNKMNPYHVNVAILICQNSEKSFESLLWEWYMCCGSEASLNLHWVHSNFAATSRSLHIFNQDRGKPLGFCHHSLSQALYNPDFLNCIRKPNSSRKLASNTFAKATLPQQDTIFVHFTIRIGASPGTFVTISCKHVSTPRCLVPICTF